MTTIDLYKYWSPSHDEYSNRDNWAWPELQPWHWIKDCHRTADLGCGTGQMTRKLIAEGHDCVGITYQQSELGDPNVHPGDMHDLPFANAEFDAIVIWDSLEHCISPFIALAEARRVTKLGGRGLIFMPGEMWIGCPYHLFVLNIKQMVQLLTLTGWRLVTVVDCSQVQPQAAFYCVENSSP